MAFDNVILLADRILRYSTPMGHIWLVGVASIELIVPKKKSAES